MNSVGADVEINMCVCVCVCVSVSQLLKSHLNV